MSEHDAVEGPTAGGGQPATPGFQGNPWSTQPTPADPTHDLAGPTHDLADPTHDLAGPTANAFDPPAAPAPDGGVEWTPPAGTALLARRPEAAALGDQPTALGDQAVAGIPPQATPPPAMGPPGTSPYGTSPYGTGAGPTGVPSGTSPYGSDPYGSGSHFGSAPPTAPGGGGGTGWGYVPWTPAGWPPGPHGAPPTRRGRPALILVAVAAVVAAFLGVVIGHAAWQPSASSINSAFNGSGNGSGSGSGSSPLGGVTPTTNSGPSNAAAIAAKVSPGLVDVNTTLSYQDAQAAGTGMVLTPNGEVLTNNHVIDGATSISVTDIGNGKTYPATVVGYDRIHDIAILQLKGASGLQTVVTADSSKVGQGEKVVGIGNAGGRGGTPSYAGGTVTALSQSITASDASNNTTEQLNGLIEDDANIQPGDSGGPLVNESGQVIGMDTAASQGFSFQSSGAGAQGYAIPINQALNVAKQIETTTTTTGDVHIGPTAFLGVEVQAPSNGASPFGGFGGNFGNGSGNGGPSTTTTGAVIVGVVSGSPAAQAGLTPGDTITGLSGHTVSSANDLTAEMVQEGANATASLTYVDSSGQQHTVTVHLSPGPPQ